MPAKPEEGRRRDDNDTAPIYPERLLAELKAEQTRQEKIIEVNEFAISLVVLIDSVLDDPLSNLSLSAKETLIKERNKIHVREAITPSTPSFSSAERQHFSAAISLVLPFAGEAHEQVMVLENRLNNMSADLFVSDLEKTGSEEVQV